MTNTPDSDRPDFDRLRQDKQAWAHCYAALKDDYPQDLDLSDLKVALSLLDRQCDTALSSWLIALFNRLFHDQDTILVRGDDEPNYYAKTADSPAQIVFAHGYAASALHEISHWCIAGRQRRLLDDFGYWYCPDGRSQDEQTAFEQVEVTPQAIECLFTYAIGRPFFVSMDNLTGNKNPDSTFAHDVYQKAAQFLATPSRLPADARRLLAALGSMHQLQ